MFTLQAFFGFSGFAFRFDLSILGGLFALFRFQFFTQGFLFGFMTGLFGDLALAFFLIAFDLFGF